MLSNRKITSIVNIIMVRKHILLTMPSTSTDTIMNWMLTKYKINVPSGDRSEIVSGFFKIIKNINLTSKNKWFVRSVIIRLMSMSSILETMDAGTPEDPEITELMWKLFNPRTTRLVNSNDFDRLFNLLIAEYY
jgi:hypothetical protein